LPSKIFIAYEGKKRSSFIRDLPVFDAGGRCGRATDLIPLYDVGEDVVGPLT
jgi:hypothetical protein